MVKETNNPEYNHTVVVPLNRKDKSCLRIFKRNVAKVEVMNKGEATNFDLGRVVAAQQYKCWLTNL